MFPHPNDRAIDPAQVLIEPPFFDQFYARPITLSLPPISNCFYGSAFNTGIFELGNLLDGSVQTIQDVDDMFDGREDPERLETRERLSAIAHHLKLTPYRYSIDAFITLQLQYLPCLHMRQDYLEEYRN